MTTTRRDEIYWNRGFYQGFELAKGYAKSLGYIPEDMGRALYVATNGQRLTRRQIHVNYGFNAGYVQAIKDFKKNGNVVPDSWIREVKA